MLRKLLGTGLLLATLAGCTKLEGRECASDSDCGGETGRCDLSVGLCYQAGTEPETDNCSPVCAAYQACTTAGCTPRFTALTLLSPANNAVLGGGTVQVQARLVANPTYASTTQYPDTLIFSAARTDTGDVGSFGTVTRDGDTYTVSWTPPSAQTQITLTAAHPTPVAVQSAAVNVQVDTIAPTFTVAFSSPPTRATGTAGTQADERDPTTEFGVAFRRDEPVTVKLSANEPVSEVMLTVVGIGPGGTAGAALAPIAVQPGGTCDGSPVFCGNVTMDLSVPEMRDVRGTMEFRVQGQDAVGNRGSASAGLKVTRWKWAFDAPGRIDGTPAIGHRGTIYLGTDVNTGNGKTLALDPNGAKVWEFASGDVLASLAVGAFSSNEEYVYVAAKNGSNPLLYVLRGSNGSKKLECSPSGGGSLQTSVAVGPTPVTTGTAETGVSIYSQGRIVEARPDALAIEQCTEVSGGGVSASILGGALVMRGQHIFYGTGVPSVISYDLGTGSNTPRNGWPQTTSHTPRGFAVIGDVLYGGAGTADNPALGNLFKIPAVTGGSISRVYPADTSLFSRVFNLAVGSGNVAYFGSDSGTTDKNLLSLGLDTTGVAPASVPNVGTLRSAPAIGKNDRLYTVNTQGRVEAWTASTLTSQWSADLTLILDAVDASPALDCRRDATGQGLTDKPLGTLYVGGSARLFALVVDSPGLDPNAPWPKFQHDARNSGNPATPITSCP